mmetsp:Transcript_27746/g.89504  ORF Transcript_27746/g.89504 Transcript_27746/m.89504 type:complete len:372 (+) Transcript_27746:872-1987(+)
MDGLFNALRGADEVDAEEAGVLVAGVEVHVGVADVLFGREEPRQRVGAVDAASGGVQAVPLAEHVLEDHYRRGIFGGPVRAGIREGDVRTRLFFRGRRQAHFRRSKGRGVEVHGKICLRFPWDSSKELRGQIDDFSMVDGPRRDDEHTRRRVVRFDVVPEILLVNGLDILFRPENCPAQPAILKSSGVQQIQQKFFVLLVDFLHLAHDHVPLPFDGPGLQQRILEDVRQDFHPEARVFLEELGVVHSLFPRRVRVEVRSVVLDHHLELTLVPLRRPLKGHVLQEVRRPVVLLGLVAAPGVDPHTDRRRLALGHRPLRRHTEPVLQHRQLRHRRHLGNQHALPRHPRHRLRRQRTRAQQTAKRLHRFFLPFP